MDEGREQVRLVVLEMVAELVGKDPSLPLRRQSFVHRDARSSILLADVEACPVTSVIRRGVHELDLHTFPLSYLEQSSQVLPGALTLSGCHGPRHRPEQTPS